MQRRLVLAVLALATLSALSGCADAAGSLRMTSVTDAELAERASEPATGAERYPGIYVQQQVRRAIENGSLTLTGAPDSLLPASAAYRYDGRYYAVSRESVDRVPGSRTLLAVDYNATDPAGPRLAFADLPAVDRQRLRPLLANPPADVEPGSEAQLPLSYRDPAANASRLVEHGGETVVVTYRGRAYAVELEPFQRSELTVYRLQATPVGSSPGEFAAHLREQYGFALSGLSDAERSVVESALDDSYYAENTDDAGFDALVDRFRRHEAVERDEYSGTWLARYDGRLYWVEMRYGAFVEDESRISSPGVTPH